MKSKTIVDVIENTLGIELKRKNIIKYEFTPSSLFHLGIEIEKFYNKDNFQLKEKEDYELRPYILPTINRLSADQIGFRLAFLNDEDKIDKDIESEMFIQNVKKYLLYTHSICIHDPLPYHLDYFRFLDKSFDDIQINHLSIIKYILMLYTEIKELLVNQIVIPMSDTTFSGLPTYFPEKDEESDYYQRVLNDNVINDYYIDQIKINLVRKSFLNSGFDFIFPNKDCVECYKAIMNYLQYNYISKETTESYNCNEILSFQCIDPDKISMKDIIYIRKNEEMFHKWRSFINSILKKYYDLGGSFNDKEAEFKYLLHEEVKLNEDIYKSNLFKDNFRHSSQIIGLSVLTGGIAGIVTQDIFASIIGAAIPSAFEELMKLKDLRKDKVMKDHFLTLNVNS